MLCRPQSGASGQEQLLVHSWQLCSPMAHHAFAFVASCTMLVLPELILVCADFKLQY
jgi:hypothetical protein